MKRNREPHTKVFGEPNGNKTLDADETATPFG